ncbi:MAG: pimeloyl-ACP methyl ester esterase BioH [Gammaproteobacteria bacterium]|nr:pimeloyl-ACP methyl ester esterase BioH [Gammaproteobacteria bacterium]
MRLHVESGGAGSDLFLVHGWCLHSGVWNGLLPQLEKNYRVTCVDLPGHGYSRALPMPGTIQSLARELLDVAPPDAVWLGWSLGGLACLRAAVDNPQRIRALVLVCATPRFLTATDWPHAMPLQQLQNLVDELRNNYRTSVQRFLALQVHEDSSARAMLRQLRALLYAHGEPSPADLERGLMLLRDTDLRPELERVQQPTLAVMGGYDRLVPAQAGQAIAAAIHGAQCMVFPKAAHAPFLSDPTSFISVLQQFMQAVPERISTNSANQLVSSARCP